MRVLSWRKRSEPEDALINRQDLDLFIAEPIWSEVLHELWKRVAGMARRRQLTPNDVDAALDTARELLEQQIRRVPEADYRPYEQIARRRIPRDPNDWPTVATAILLDAAIWTSDHDFFGCGLPTWTTETLLAELNG